MQKSIDILYYSDILEMLKANKQMLINRKAVLTWRTKQDTRRASTQPEAKSRSRWMVGTSTWTLGSTTYGASKSKAVVV